MTDSKAKQVNSVSTQSGLQLEDLNPNKVTHMAMMGEKKQVDTKKIRTVKIIWQV